MGSRGHGLLRRNSTRPVIWVITMLLCKKELLRHLDMLYLLVLICTPFIAAQGDPQIEGTWTTKSRKVVTGPGFYDPVNERMFEPELTGFSYSFTTDGYYESAYYRAVSNPTNPACPQGIIQWQHGKYTKNDNGSLSLFPIPVDGRQLESDPCTYKSALYIRWSQFELMKKYEVVTDEYSKAQRLNLYRFDGAPLNPMYLAYKPPQMLPTQTLNPTASATGAAAAKATGKVKRDLYWGDEGLEGGEEDEQEHNHFTHEPLNRHVLVRRTKGREINAEKWWWIGVGLTGLGGAAWYLF